MTFAASATRTAPQRPCLKVTGVSEESILVIRFVLSTAECGPP
jgi:hypothetical protein